MAQVVAWLKEVLGSELFRPSLKGHGIQATMGQGGCPALGGDSACRRSDWTADTFRCSLSQTTAHQCALSSMHTLHVGPPPLLTLLQRCVLADFRPGCMRRMSGYPSEAAKDFKYLFKVSIAFAFSILRLQHLNADTFH